jgi:hypothetical protein
MVRHLSLPDTTVPPVANNNHNDGRTTMETQCERRGQVEVGIVTHNGHVYAALGSSVSGRNLTAYSRHRDGCLSLARWDGSTMLACRSEIVRDFSDGSLALMFRLTHGRFIVGYSLGDDGMLFRGELLTDCTEDDARREAIAIAEHWMKIDAEDVADPWHGEPDEPDDGDNPIR